MGLRHIDQQYKLTSIIWQILYRKSFITRCLSWLT